MLSIHNGSRDLVIVIQNGSLRSRKKTESTEKFHTLLHWFDITFCLSYAWILDPEDTIKRVHADPDPWHFGTDPDAAPRILTFDSGLGSESCFFRQLLSRDQQKIIKSSCFFLYGGTFTSFFTKLIRKSQNSRNQGFSSFFFVVDGRTRIRTNKLRIRMRIQEAKKHTAPMDLYADPEQWRGYYQEKKTKIG